MAYIRDGSLHDRRRRSDGIVKIINTCAFLCFILSLVAVYFLVNASPSMDGMISSFAGTTFENAKAVTLGEYNMTWMRRFLVVSFVIASLSGTGLYLNSRRIKRKRDNYYISLVFFCGLSTLSILVVFFGVIL